MNAIGVSLLDVKALGIDGQESTCQYWIRGVLRPWPLSRVSVMWLWISIGVLDRDCQELNFEFCREVLRFGYEWSGANVPRRSMSRRCVNDGVKLERARERHLRI
uniref:Uncharacterized protein n=1 Tax=Cucumis sativus TaxID=3659 RepID=A0A0A0KA22_CUCSA